MNLTATETANLFRVSREAIRKYCLEFDAYLSPVASPQKGRQRMFTPDDLEVIGLIIELKAEGKLFADIHAALSNGQRGGVPVSSNGIAPTVPSSQLALQSQIDKLQTDLEQERALRHDAEGQIKQLEKQIDKLLDRLFNREE